MQVVKIFTELAQFNPDSFVHVIDHLPANYVLVIDEAGVLPRIGEFLDKFSPYVSPVASPISASSKSPRESSKPRTKSLWSPFRQAVDVDPSLAGAQLK